MTQPQAGQRDHVVADGTDPVLGLPPAPASDTDSGVEGMVPDESDQGVAVGVRKGFERLRQAEDRPPLRAPRAELGLRHEGHVDLKPPGQEEDADGACTDLQVPVVLRAEFVVEPTRPAVQGFGEIAADGEDDIGVRPAVTDSDGMRPGERGTDDGLVGFGVREQPVSDAVPLFDGEHHATLLSSCLRMAISIGRSTRPGRRNKNRHAQHRKSAGDEAGRELGIASALAQALRLRL
ncbi:hypothetical protein ACFWP7_13515 [Streptomyces sp. NPDC058470]|uniref:hypothetical protein n=1 Tax=Streptomyces sp. NPDC058470 TaxID=3346515 RepID=UPI00364A302F